MKKLFLFATIAAAGLFASCSSSDDAVSDALNNPIEDADGRQAIKIGISNIVNMATRGTGTVGGVEHNNTINNVWAGQRINAFMFTQNRTVVGNTETWTPTLNLTTVNDIPLYDNQVMITPGTTDNLIDYMNASVASGEAMIEDGTINYYPIEGRYDFFGYHGDDAVNVNDGINKEADKWTVPFEIDGSQDLMSTKAILTADQAAVMATAGTPEGSRSEDYYSAYSARRGVQPTLTFNHLLTRLAFKVKAGNVNASGYEAAVSDNDAKTHNAGLPNAVSTSTANVYSFTAYVGETDQAPYYAGKVVKVSDDGTYTIVKVIVNEVNDFVNRQFAVHAIDLSGGTTFELLDESTKASLSPKIFVKGVAASAFSDAEAIAYNATLPGAISAHAEGQNLAKAVKVTSIKIKSKKTGKMAVAWTEDPTNYIYEMSPITKTDYDALVSAQVDVTNWGTAIHQDPNDDNSAITGYSWTGLEVNRATYLSLTNTERKYATVKTSDAAKIDWTLATVDWLTLKERPYAKLKSGESIELADFEGGDALADKKADFDAADAALTTEIKNNYTTAKSELEDAQAALDAASSTDPDYGALQDAVTAKQTAYNAAAATYDPLKATYDAAKAAYDLVKDEADALLALVSQTGYITKYGFDKLKAASQTAKFDDIHTTNLNENLIALAPTAPSTDLAATTDVGEALIVAPKTETGEGANNDYEMLVTIKQDVPTNWNEPDKLSTKEIEYPLTIKAPNDGFKQNYSYNIILTVYGLERIEVITVITPWEDTHNPIVIGADN